MPLPRGYRFSLCKHGHPFTLANTYIRPDNGRQQCRESHRIRNRNYKRRKRMADRREAPPKCRVCGFDLPSRRGLYTCDNCDQPYYGLD